MARVLVWNEYRHERSNPAVSAIYPDGIHQALAAPLRQAGHDVRTATLDEPEHGLGAAALGWAEVILWWGHKAHADVDDATVDRLHAAILAGTGLVVLHSGHFSKLFKRLMGTSCDLKWRVADERERIWIVDPAHPIAQGLPETFTIDREEMYGEHFDIPAPDELVMISWFQGGEVFRSGCCWHRGQGRVFYFRPGHETYPSYHQPMVQRVIANGVAWAAATNAIRLRRGKVAAHEAP